MNECCEDSVQVKQLKQWARCIDLIEEFEVSNGISFGAVVKIRPDDLWSVDSRNHLSLI